MKSKKAIKLREIGINQESMHLPRNADVKLAICRYEQRKVARRMFSVFDQLATNGKTVGGFVVNGKLQGGVVYPPTLTKLEAVSGNNMFSLYAVWKGRAGAADREDIGFVQESRSEPELVTDRMLRAGREFKAITSRMKPGMATLLVALCHDMVFSDGSMILTEARPIDHTGKPEMEKIKTVRKAAAYEWGDADGKVRSEIERAKPAKLTPKVRWREIVRTVAGINDRDCQRDMVKRMCADLVQAIDESRLEHSL